MDYWLVNVSGFAVAAVLLLKLSARTGDWLTPAHAFSFTWIANLLAVQLLDGAAYIPSVVTLALLFVGWWAFLLGAWIVLRRPIRTEGRWPSMVPSRAVGLVWLIVLAQVLAIGMEARALGIPLQDYVVHAGTLDPAFRLANAYREVDLPAYLEPWRWAYVYYVPIAILLYRQRHISWRALLLLLAIGLTSSLERFTRAPLLQVAAVTAAATLMVYRPKTKVAVPVLLVVGLGAIGLFALMQTNLVAGDRLARATPAESIVAYIGGPMRAYDLLVSAGVERSADGLYSLDAPYYLLYKAGLIGGYPSLVRPYAFIPLATNLYTFLDAYTIDMGLPGVAIGSCITGLLAGWLYRRLRERPSVSILVVYSYAIYACLMAGANNEFIRFGFALVWSIAWIIERVLCRSSVAYSGRRARVSPVQT